MEQLEKLKEFKDLGLSEKVLKVLSQVYQFLLQFYLNIYLISIFF